MTGEPGATGEEGTTGGSASIAIRPAATLVVVRDSGTGPEALMLQRNHSVVFAAGAHVFPGGAVDDADRDGDAAELFGLGDDEASRILGVPDGGLAFWVAAVRETFEESGLLLATYPDGAPLGRDHPVFAEVDEWRRRCEEGSVSFLDLCRSHDLRVDARAIRYLSRWVTPPGNSRRYDTRFFVARATDVQAPRADGSDTVSAEWWSPMTALEHCDSGRVHLILPTRRSLERLAAMPSVDRWLSTLDEDPSGPPPGDRASPAPRTDTLNVGVPDRLDPLVTRLVAPNPGPMTGPGTNTYIVGDLDASESPLVVVDPGPDADDHIGRIVELVGHRLAAIVLTHTHPDHWPAADRLHQLTDAPRVAWPPESDAARAGGNVEVERRLADGDVVFAVDDPSVTSGLPWTLSARYTPGHASNHVCFLLSSADDASPEWCFSGDHLMVGSTVVIAPPDGDLDEYLASLAWLVDGPVRRLAPGHGPDHADAGHLASTVVRHRARREEQLVAVLERLGPSRANEIVAAAYRGLSAELVPVAANTVWAHMRRLVRQGRVTVQDADGWALTVGDSDTIDSVWAVA